MIFNLYKHRGETPLERIQKFVEKNPELKKEKMTYLGRLDPLAEGVLLVATGKDIKRKEEFLRLDKEYNFISVFGFTTDTYDVLGRVMKEEKLDYLDENDIRKVSTIYEGEREQKYPLYSSKMISSFKQKKPAPLPASSEEEKKIIPSKIVKIYKLQFHGLDVLNSKELFGRLLMDISKVRGDFRQHEILVLWREMLFKYSDAKIFLGRFSAHVSAGTYIRSLVNDMGNTLGCGATTLFIRRTRVGNYKIEDSLKA